MKYALVTIYRPEPSVAAHIEAIAQQVDRVFLCDNSSRSNAQLFASLGSDVTYLFFGANLGLSRAFNRVLKDPAHSFQENDCILFFDQDSKIAPGHVDALIRQFQETTAAGYPVGCLGPVYFNTSSGQVESPRMKRQLTDQVYSVSGIITSSMVARYGDLKKVGFWNEEVFLDMADWALCWRFLAAGLLCCQTDAVVLHHSIGREEKRFGPLRLRVGAPVREYYQIRDCLYLLGKPETPLKYRVRFLAMILVRSPLHVLLLDEKKARMRYILRGLGDFLKKRTGPLE